jgi:hypothetical protein
MVKIKKLSSSKKKTAKNKPKSKAQAPQRSAPPAPSKSKAKQIPMHKVNAVCSNTDPFCTHASGAKMLSMMSSSVRTLPYSYRSMATYSTNASGDLVVLVYPTYNNLPGLPFTYSGGTWVIPANFVQYTMPLASGVRIVSAGFVVRCISAPLYRSGSVAIRGWGNGNMDQFFTAFDPMNFNATSILNIPLSECKETAVVLARDNFLPFEHFFSTGVGGGTTGTGIQSPEGMLPVSIMVSGGPASTGVVSVEYFINWELCFNQTHSLALVATPPPMPDPAISDAVAVVRDTVGSTASSIFQSGVRAAGDYIKRKVVQAVATRFLGPAAGSATQAIMVD